VFTLSPSPLGPGQAIDYAFTMNVPTDFKPEGSLWQNCAEIVWLGNTPDSNPANDRACSTFTVAAHSNLKLEKHAGGCRKNTITHGWNTPIDENPPLVGPGLEAAGAGVSSPNSVTTVNCVFRIAVTNTGPGSYSGPILINEAVPQSATLDSSSCTPNQAGQYSCDLAPGGATLAPHESINQLVSVTIDAARLDASTCALGNMASIKEPH
jgi:hypothetical protein